jgi:A/G-specific adenine glycosylase
MKPDLTPRTLPKFQSALLDWFAVHRRDLPWRASRDPYRIWVAEIMLQQTRIAAVLPYYHRFLKKFPTAASLRRARLEEVLKLWSGLGYYSRARNLHRAAREIASHHSGEFPRTLDDALALPGIGRYTAAAVLSISYDVPLAVLDGNVARVLARLGAVRGDLREPKTWRLLSERAQQLLALKVPGNWNQALMELGEVICTPQSPRCRLCPVSRWCQARAKNLTAEIPSVRKKRAPVKVRIAAAVLSDPQGRTLLVRDPGAHDHVLFSRMWQFPAVEVSRDPKSELAQHLYAILKMKAASLHLEVLPEARHGVTFRNITLLPYLAHVRNLPKLPRTRIVQLGNLATLPVSSATRKIAAAAASHKLPLADSRRTQAPDSPGC